MVHIVTTLLKIGKKVQNTIRITIKAKSGGVDKEAVPTMRRKDAEYRNDHKIGVCAYKGQTYIVVLIFPLRWQQVLCE
jgi:hypothetical protein